MDSFLFYTYTCVCVVQKTGTQTLEALSAILRNGLSFLDGKGFDFQVIPVPVVTEQEVFQTAFLIVPVIIDGPMIRPTARPDAVNEVFEVLAAGVFRFVDADDFRIATIEIICQYPYFICCIFRCHEKYPFLVENMVYIADFAAA